MIMKNLVQVTHLEDHSKRRYTFEVPLGKRLKKGDIVLVNTKWGLKQVKCVTDSLLCPEPYIDMIMEGKSVTGRVIGKYTYEEFTWESEGEK